MKDVKIVMKKSKKKIPKFKPVHIQDPLSKFILMAACNTKDKGLITLDWFKVSCPKCNKIMRKMLNF